MMILPFVGLKKTSNFSKTTGKAQSGEDTAVYDDCNDFLSHKQPKSKLLISNNSRFKESSERFEEGTQLDELLHENDENNNNAGIYHI
jgi:hypothetical protein